MTPREPNGRIRMVKEVGFPIALCLMFLSGFSFMGIWMTNNQDRLIESTVVTNTSLAKATERNSDTFAKIQQAVERQDEILDSRTKLFTDLAEQNMLILKCLQDANDKMSGAPNWHAETQKLLRELIEAVRKNQPAAVQSGNTG